MSLPWICKIVGVQQSNSPAHSELRVLTLSDCDNSRSQQNKASTEYDSPAAHWATQGIEFHRLNLSRKLFNPFRDSHGLYAGLDFVRALKVLLIQGHYDYILCYFESPAYFLSIFKKLGLLRNPRIIVNEINYGNEWRLRKRIVDTVIKNVDIISVITEHLASKLRNDPECNATIYESGFFIAEEAFTMIPFPEEAGYFLAIGDDSSRDYHTLMAAIRSVNPAIQFKLKTKQNLDVKGLVNVELISGHLSREELISLYENAVAVIIPLRYVPTPGGITSLLEAFAMGKCVLISDTPSLKEYLVGEHCIKYDTSNKDALSNCITEVWDDRVTSEFVGIEAKAFFDEHCKKRRYFKAYAGFLKRFVGQ